MSTFIYANHRKIKFHTVRVAECYADRGMAVLRFQTPTGSWMTIRHAINTGLVVRESLTEEGLGDVVFSLTPREFRPKLERLVMSPLGELTEMLAILMVVDPAHSLSGTHAVKSKKILCKVAEKQLLPRLEELFPDYRNTRELMERTKHWNCVAAAEEMAMEVAEQKGFGEVHAPHFVAYLKEQGMDLVQMAKDIASGDE